MSFCPEIMKIREPHRSLAQKVARGEKLSAYETLRQKELAPDPAFKGLVSHFKKELPDA